MKIDYLTWSSGAALCLAVLPALTGCAENRMETRQTPVAAQTHAPTPPASTDAKSTLLRMARFLGAAPHFSVSVSADYDVLQESGEKIEFGETRKIIVNRPNDFFVESKHSNGEKHVTLYDGKEITIFSPAQNVYAQASKSGGIDSAITYFVKDLHMRLPLAVLLLSRIADELEQRTQSVAYVESTVIGRIPAHHLAGRTDTVDYQVWIADGDRPLPLRVVLTYRNAESQPQFRARFSDWDLAPKIHKSQFTFKPPEGARKIAFVAQFPQIGLPQATASEKTGGQQ